MKTQLDQQLECLSIAQTLPAAFQQSGVQSSDAADCTRYTLFFDSQTGLACFDPAWTQGDAYSEQEQLYCRHHGLKILGYFSQYDLIALDTRQLARQLYDFLTLIALP